MIKKYQVLLFLCSILLTFSCGEAATYSQYYQAAVNALEKNEYDLAVQYCQNALELQPDLWQVYHVLAESYHGLQKDPQAMEAAKKSLELHPANAPLRKFVDELKTENPEIASKPPADSVKKLSGALFEPEKPVNGASGAETEVVSTHPISKAQVWVKAYGGYAYGSLGDFNQAVPAWHKTYKSVAKADAGNSGDLFTLEAGIPLDPSNGLALDLAWGQFTSFAGEGLAVTTISGNPVTFNFAQDASPSLFTAELGYYHFWNQKDGRFFLKGAAGYGLAVVNYFGQLIIVSPYDLTEGPLDVTAGSFCLSGSIGYEWMLSPGFGLELSLRGRYASFKGLTGNATVSNSNNPSIWSGTAGLYKSPNGALKLDPSDKIPAGDTLATVDFSGFDAGLSINAYFF